MIDISKELSEILDVGEEKDKDVIEELETLDCKDGFVFLALVAPYFGVKVSPSKILSASLGISEEFGLEEAITKIKELTDKIDENNNLIIALEKYIDESSNQELIEDLKQMIKDLQEENEDLQDEINDLEDDIDDLYALIPPSGGVS